MQSTDPLKFRATGYDVTIFPKARILQPENIILGSHIIIDDFVFIGMHDRLVIGNHVHIASHASITGGGECLICDFSGISSGVRVLTGSDDFGGSALTGPTIPSQFRKVLRKRTVILPHAIIGANSVVLPGVVIGEGAAVGAGSIVTGDLEPWSLYVGAPARRLRERPWTDIARLEAALFREEGAAECRFVDTRALDQW
jgi:galactoside O-acetyltransferase